MPLSSAFNASGDVYSISSYSMGSSENVLEGADLTGRNALSYQQGAGSATSTIYSLDLGGSKQISTPSEELTTPEETAAEGSTGSSGGGVGCASGYELINGKCVEIEEVEEIPSQLFDITFNLEDTIIQNSNELTSIVTFESFGTIPTPVDLTFIVLDEDGNEVYRKKSKITVTTEEVLRWNYETLGELSKGKYVAILQTLYNVDVYDEFRQDFEIGKEKRGITGKVVDLIGGKVNLWIVEGVIGLFVLGGLAWWLIKKQKKRKEKKQRKKVKVRKKSLFTKKGTIIKIIDKKSRGRKRR